jgi:hypothetical protein
MMYIRCRRTLCITDILKTRVLCGFLDIPYSVSILVLVWSLTKSDLTLLRGVGADEQTHCPSSHFERYYIIAGLFQSRTVKVIPLNLVTRITCIKNK